MITLYSTNCPQCQILEKKLDATHIQYVVDDNIETMQAKGFTSAPMLEVGDVTMNFSEAVRWLKDYVD